MFKLETNDHAHHFFNSPIDREINRGPEFILHNVIKSRIDHVRKNIFSNVDISHSDLLRKVI